MNKKDILARISHEAQSYHLPAATALDTYAEILAELASTLDSNDLEALIAIGTVLLRAVHPAGRAALSRQPGCVSKRNESPT
ncbi:hypothetical protein [Paraburkholderia heleia]|uniref:hypothetical protein n=1 Tax=Paraburkholderia heleia TaxID=634127 RepID=UPI002AB69C52|nr:hypothetical protein [Paraburkholderia heleia]